MTLYLPYVTLDSVDKLENERKRNPEYINDLFRNIDSSNPTIASVSGHQFAKNDEEKEKGRIALLGYRLLELNGKLGIANGMDHMAHICDTQNSIIETAVRLRKEQIVGQSPIEVIYKERLDLIHDDNPHWAEYVYEQGKRSVEPTHEAINAYLILERIVKKTYSKTQTSEGAKDALKKLDLDEFFQSLKDLKQTIENSHAQLARVKYALNPDEVAKTEDLDSLDLEGLALELNIAIGLEDYERAVTIRDKIQAMTGKEHIKNT
jgi:hypothetical protein